MAEIHPRAEYDLILGRVGELWLKGRNRNDFVQQLRRNLQASLKAELKGAQVQPAHGRFFVRLADPAHMARALEICRDTPGLHSVSPVRRVARDIDAILAGALALAAAEWADHTGTFRVVSRRADKTFPLTSPQINQEIGYALHSTFGLSADLNRADVTLGVEVERERAHVFVHSHLAAGGLPIGSAGRVLLLLSGGIDSPVAGYLAQKRGCALDAVYFHSAPFISESSRDKVETLANLLGPRQGGLRLHVVHFTDIQKAIRDNCDKRLTVVLYRRFMYRIAGRIADQRKARALCTGESIGQVASQTLENLALVDGVTNHLTIRPLLTYDKDEVVDVARRIGSFETSILPHQDCCTLFVPKNPAIRAKLHIVERAEARLDLEALIEGALARTDVVECGAAPDPL